MLNQAFVFFLVIVWGNIVGVIFDGYRTLRQLFRPGFWGTSIGDTVFWLIVTSLTYLFLMLISWGEVRFYVFLGIVIGLIIYLKLFSKTVRRLLLKLLFSCKSLIIFFYKVICKFTAVFRKLRHGLNKGVFKLM